MPNRGKGLLNPLIKNWKVIRVLKSEWEGYWQNCINPNLLQSWEYGQAKEGFGKWSPQRLVIFNGEGEPIALVQVLTWCLPIFGGIARINRGPLPLITTPKEAESQLMIDALAAVMKYARNQRWWVMQIAPEILDSEGSRQGLLGLGCERLPNVAWESGLIDLSLSEHELHGGLNRRWQRTLKKAVSLGVIVRNVSATDEELANLLKSYAELQRRNQFSGIDSSLVRKVSKYQSKDCALNLYVAELVNNDGPNENLGYRLIIRNGCVALDFLVSTNERGRELEANSALYWHAITDAKEIGCLWFDIGGLNEATPKGIAEFKRGLNSVPYRLVGEWRKLFP